MKRIIMAGFGAAAYSALMTLKRLGCRDEIIIIDPKKYELSHPCGIPFALEGKADASKLSLDIGLERMGVRKLRGSLMSIDPAAHSIGIMTADGGQMMQYDTLLCATGSVPAIPKIAGADTFLGRGLFTLSTIEDLDVVGKATGNNEKCAVIGAGAVGLETAAALVSRGCSVTVYETRESILPDVFDSDMSSPVRETLVRAGMKIMTSSKVQSFSGDGVLSHIISDDGAYDVDLCVIAAGRIPAIGYLPSGMECVARLGIPVDGFMRTSYPDILAAGDCAVTISAIDGKPVAAKLATSSFNQGEIAAYLIMGMDKAYRGSAGTFVSVIGETEIAATGFNSEIAVERGFDPVSVKISAPVTPDYFNTEDSVTIKVIADRRTSRIIGGQAIGSGASSRINILGTAIMMRAKIDDCESFELAYCPAVSDVYDPLKRAIDGLRRRIR